MPEAKPVPLVEVSSMCITGSSLPNGLASWEPKNSHDLPRGFLPRIQGCDIQVIDLQSSNVDHLLIKLQDMTAGACFWHYKSSTAEFFEVLQNSEGFALRNCQRFPISTQDSRLKWSRAWWTDTPLDGSVTSQSEPRPIDTERPGCMTNCQNCSLETKLKNLPWRPVVWHNTYSFDTVRTDLKLYIKLP